MKKFLVLVALVWAFVGCDSKESAPKSVESEVEAPKEIKITQNVVEQKEENPLIGYNIDGERVVRIAPDGQETQLTKEIGAIATVRNRYDTVGAELLKKRLSKNYILKCSACHDDYANGVVGPSLLTKSSDEIYEMIESYKHRTKVNVLMKDLVSKMPDQEIRDLANEIAEFNKEIRIKNVKK